MVQPILKRVSELDAFRLREGATNKMVALLERGKHGASTSINLEIWEVGGSQKPNTHPDSTEAFFFLSGEGFASCDGAEVQVKAGDFLILPAGSLHFIANTGSECLYALTTLLHDDGSHDPSDLPHEPLNSEDVAALTRD